LRRAVTAVALAGAVSITAGLVLNTRREGLRHKSPAKQQVLSPKQIKVDERFSFAPAQFQKDLSSLSEATKSAVLANHSQSPLQILGVSTTKDYVIAKFESPQGRWVNEHIGVSSLGGRVIETRIEQEGKLSDRWMVQFTINNSLTRQTIRKLGQASIPKESVVSTRLIQKRITSMMLAHMQHLPANAILVASPVLSDGGGRGRTAIYRRYGFKPDPNSAMSEFEIEVSISDFIKLASARADAAHLRTMGVVHPSLRAGNRSEALQTTRARLHPHLVLE
jgi:hypothetical protein